MYSYLYSRLRKTIYILRNYFKSFKIFKMFSILLFILQIKKENIFLLINEDHKQNVLQTSIIRYCNSSVPLNHRTCAPLCARKIN